jgi:polyisoprenoid-binding protein YceI
MNRQTVLAGLAMTALGIAATASATAAEWKVADGMGSVSFTAVQQGTKFTGRFEEFSAMIDLDPAAVENGSIVGIVQTSSVNTRDHDRDASLNDSDWFDSASHPEARFESESITRQEDGSYTAAGQLTLKGTTRPIDLSFTFDSSGSTAKFAGTMTINRFDYGVGEGWNDTSWVGQDVEVQVNLSLTR